MYIYYIYGLSWVYNLKMNEEKLPAKKLTQRKKDRNTPRKKERERRKKY